MLAQREFGSEAWRKRQREEISFEGRERTLGTSRKEERVLMFGLPNWDGTVGVEGEEVAADCAWNCACGSGGGGGAGKGEEEACWGLGLLFSL